MCQVKKNLKKKEGGERGGISDKKGEDGSVGPSIKEKGFGPEGNGPKKKGKKRKRNRRRR